jgi:hypothetical protein
MVRTLVWRVRTNPKMEDFYVLSKLSPYQVPV